MTTWEVDVPELFDSRMRTDEGPAKYTESRFEYLNRTARPRFGQIRELLQEWFSRYPEFDEPQWLNRFRDSDDRHHVGAFFELYTRAFLETCGLTVERE